LQNGYSASNHLPSAPPPVQNFSCPVPTGQLIELDVAVPPHSGSDESRHTYSAADSASTVLIPRTVHPGSSQHPSASLRNNSEREHSNHRQGIQQPQSHGYSTSFEIVESQPLISGKAKEDGIGTYKSWDYVFRNLESQGYSKDQGARPDILSSSPELMTGNSISHKNHSEDVRNCRHHQSSAKNLEETLMELRLEEFQKAMPIDRRPLKINEALQKIYMETDGDTCQGPLSKRPPNVDTVDGSRSVYDNMSSPPKDNPERERPVTTVLPSSKSNGSFSAVNNKESARTLPRDTRKYVEERQRLTQAGTHYSSTTLNPRHLQDVSNHYQLTASISDSSPPDRIVAIRDSTSKVRIEERQGSIVDIPFDYTHESSEVSEKNRWECVTCTFLNVPSRDICEMCGKSKVRGPEVRPLASGGRECPQCTLVNERGVGTCEACGNSLKDSPTYI
jgi:spermatogenesis-associated protein 2